MGRDIVAVGLEEGERATDGGKVLGDEHYCLWYSSSFSLRAAGEKSMRGLRMRERARWWEEDGS